MDFDLEETNIGLVPNEGSESEYYDESEEALSAEPAKKSVVR